MLQEAGQKSKTGPPGKSKKEYMKCTEKAPKKSTEEKYRRKKKSPGTPKLSSLCLCQREQSGAQAQLTGYQPVEKKIEHHGRTAPGQDREKRTE